MKKYNVTVREMVETVYTVEAENEKKAHAKVWHGEMTNAEVETGTSEGIGEMAITDIEEVQ